MLGHQDKTLSVGNLETIRVVIDVRDCVKAYYLLMQTEDALGKVFNVCGDTPRKMGFFTDELIKLSGLENVEKWVNPKFYRPIDIAYQHGDSSSLVNLTGWSTEYTISSTLQDLLDYWIKKLK